MSTPSSSRLLPVFTGLFVACLLISNVTAGAKFVQVGVFTLSAATFLFPLSFIFGDIFTEVYGYAQSRKVIWTGFGSLVLMSVYLWLIQVAPAPAFWQNQAAFDSIFGAVPRVVFASMSAYFCGEFCNSVVLSKMKYWARGKRGASQAWRFILSTIVGEGVDSLVFFTVAFAGVLAWGDLWWTMGSAYLFKVGIEIIMTPLSTRFSNWVKKVEGVDQIDRPAETRYNPFAVRV